VVVCLTTSSVGQNYRDSNDIKNKKKKEEEKEEEKKK